MTKTELATLGGGCFWCIEAAFAELRGVLKAQSGYAGGRDPDPTYEAVCGGKTGHAEVVQVTFDPQEITFREILEAFFTLHDPTTLNRQGADVGTQYRSVIFTHGPEQESVAQQVKTELEEQQVWDDPVVTEITPFTRFFVAEEYHQRYYERNPTQGYCMAVVRPKLSKFRRAWQARLKPA